MLPRANAATRSPADLDDDGLLDLIQRQTLRFFWEGAHPTSGLARDRHRTTGEPKNDLVAVGGTGFAIMAIVVAVERGWVPRRTAVNRILMMLSFLERCTRYHGMFPHFLNGRTGQTIPFGRKDDGADLVETALLFQGLICAREYFDGEGRSEHTMRQRINDLWVGVEWNWFTGGGKHLYWHWSPTHGWAMDLRITGWNECLVAYVLAAGSPMNMIDLEVYHQGFASGSSFHNSRSYYSIELPLGMNFGGPLFFAHYSFCGLDPRGLSDRYADYWEQNVRHTRINYAHCVANPHGHVGYGADCWGLTSSHGPDGYAARAPLLENISRGLLGLIGLWMLWRALRHGHHHHKHEGEAVGVMAGLIPCPLTLFVMTFAIARGVPAAGILFAGTMMIGVALTLSCVAILSILLRERLVRFVEGRPRLFEAITRSIEGVAGAALVALAIHEIFLR